MSATAKRFREIGSHSMVEAMPRWLAAVLVPALLVSGCGNGDDHADNVSAPEPTSTTQPSISGPLPGSRVQIFPYEGAQLAVVGVAADDTLHVRSGPGTDFDVVFDLEPMAMDATATGHNRSVDDAGFWSEIAVDGRTGWANTAFLLQPGQVKDITAALFPAPADRPTAKTMLELGQTIAGLRVSDDPESDIMVVDQPTAGDLGEITVDVIGLGDDSVGGERLKVFAEPGPEGETFTVRTVEATTLCRRGVTDDRLCV